MEIYKLPAITVSIPGRLEVMELSINLLTSLSISKARWRDDAIKKNSLPSFSVSQVR